MRPLAIGVTASAVLAGPPLYSLMQAGSITGETALIRGLLIAGVCTLGATFLDGIIRDFQREAKIKALGRVVHHPGAGLHQPGQPGHTASAGMPVSSSTPLQITAGKVIPGQTVPKP